MDLAKHWRLRAARYRLEGQRHSVSGAVRFPPEAPDDSWQPFELSGAGTVYSFSVVRQPPAGLDEEAPYILAMVKLAEGPMITAQLTDCDAEQIAIDMPVQMVTRRLRDLGPDGLLVYGYKFRPLLG
ncbi:MAG TPA: Zn-ribbon domain-containing OB-fold protein [Kouleothrix sp.]|nr:Zn-ribbon domain-containing OB-fold protein [Kouleothrix sp.]HRC75182.1 Zn-ribbon domain-containing OB-fold protein [Kouleothrix sp.]